MHLNFVAALIVMSLYSAWCFSIPNEPFFGSSSSASKRMLAYMLNPPYRMRSFVEALSFPPEEKCVVVLVGGLRLNEALSFNMPFLSGRLRSCPIGLMSRDCRRRENVGSIYVTIALGMRAAGDERASLAFGVTERINGGTVKEAYEHLYGKPPTGKIVHLGWRAIAKLNKARKLCGLGWALSENDIPSYFVGAACHRYGLAGYGASLLTDEYGCIKRGVIGNRLCKREAIGQYVIWLTDVAALTKVVKEALQMSRFTVVEICDALSAARASEAGRRMALLNIDRIMHSLVELCQGQSVFVWLVVPFPPNMRNEPQLTLVAALSHLQCGVLLSGTTNWAGIISATDLAVTWLRQLGLRPPEHMTGHPICFIKVTGAPKMLRDLNEWAIRHFKSYPGALIGIIVVCALTLLGSSIALAFSKGLKVMHLRLLELMALASFSSPTALFLAGAFGMCSPLWAALFIILFGASVSAIGLRFKAIDLAHIIASATLLLVASDCSIGCALLRNSFITYTPINGWRFYGLGNEITGALIPWCALTLTQLFKLHMQRAFKIALASLFWVVAVALAGAPQLGANFGGALSIGVCIAGLSGWLLYGQQNSKVQTRAVWTAIASLFAVPIVLGFLSLFSGVESHISKFLFKARSYDWVMLLGTIERKLSLHVEVIIGQPAYLIGIVFLLALTALLPRMGHILNSASLDKSNAAISFSCVGLWAMLIFNDTGALAIAPGLVIAISYAIIAVVASAKLKLHIAFGSSAPTIAFNGG